MLVFAIIIVFHLMGLLIRVSTMCLFLRLAMMVWFLLMQTVMTNIHSLLAVVIK